MSIHKMVDQENKERMISTGPLRYRLGGPEGGTHTHESFPEVGVVLNASDSALCFITTRPLEEGQTIVIKCPWLAGGTETCTVRWCRKEAIDLWRVDLQRKQSGEPPS